MGDIFMSALKDTKPDQAAFYINLFNKAVATYTKDDYVSVCGEDHIHDSYQAMCNHMDIEMVRLGFEFGRMYERFGVVV